MAKGKVVKSTSLYMSGNNVKDLVKNCRVESYNFAKKMPNLPKSSYYATLAQIGIRISALCLTAAALRKLYKK